VVIPCGHEGGNALVPVDPLIRVLSGATPEQARVLWDALQQWLDASDPADTYDHPEQVPPAVAAQRAAAESLQRRLDAAMALP